MPRTPLGLELQITQEYFGQARHTVFLVPMWKETLDFLESANDRCEDVANVLEGVVVKHG